MNQADKLTAEAVANYLQQTPDFFNDHPELLETLTIPHPSTGNVISLVAKQLEVFRHKQQALKTQLDTLIENAKNNDLYASRMHQLTLALLSSETLEMALTQLKRILTDCFLADFVALKIIQPNADPTFSDIFINPDHETLPYFTPEFIHAVPRCGRLTVIQNRLLFADFAAQVKSCAIIPIVSADFTALLVIGSRDENRFHHSLGNFFLTQLRDIVGTRLATLLKS